MLPSMIILRPLKGVGILKLRPLKRSRDPKIEALKRSRDSNIKALKRSRDPKNKPPPFLGRPPGILNIFPDGFNKDPIC